MVYSTLVSLEKTIDQILDPHRFSIFPDERKLLLSLNKCVISFQAFLEDFPEKAKSLEGRIRDVAAEAEDIIEWFILEQIRYNYYRYTKWIAILRGIKFLHQLSKVSNEMDAIAGVMVEMKSSTPVKDTQLGVHHFPGTAPASDTGKTIMFYPNEDLKEIKARLCGDPPQLQVLPIFGRGGIGKTTLARKAYSDQLIMEHFDIRAWVTISHVYSARKFFLDLLVSISETNPEQRNASNAKLSNTRMAEKVHKVLKGRRFLIVLDDIRSAKVLGEVRKFFPNDRNGSRIMLTTRLREVATCAISSIPFHEMRLMDADQSWTLLRHKVQYHIPPELESTGREIARRCGGLPLAITLIAGILSPISWENVSKNVKLSLASMDEHVENILSLSYTHLPHHLRPCFLYLGGFPEAEEIKATKLTRLWIAEGFVKPTESETFEDTTQGYLEDLAKRNLIIVEKSKYSGKIKYCSLHDMVREMCIKLSQEEKFLVHVKSGQGLALQKSMKGQRRISISHSDVNSFANIFSSTIRTILYFQDNLGSFGSFRLLKVLDVVRVKFNSPLIPDQFFELFHLRYLAFRYNASSIPRAISNLQNLQTLIIQGHIFDLPHEIWNMPQLRHILCSYVFFAYPSDAPLALKHLQTLGEVRDYDFRFLNMFPNLKRLRLKYPSLKNRSCLDNLVSLSLLETLHIELEQCSGNIHDAPNLVVPSSLTKLTLIGWGYNEPHLNIVGPLPNLQVLKLKRFCFEHQKWATNDEDFPQLKYLLIDSSDLRQWKVEGSHFPKLKELRFRSCWNLSQIPEGIRDIQTLELLELKYCKKSLADSAELMQEEFQVCCIHCNMSDL